MTPTAEHVLTAALELAEDDRLQVVEALLVSIQAHEPPPIDDALLETIRRRTAEVDAGLVTPIPWAEVKRRAREVAGG